MSQSNTGAVGFLSIPSVPTIYYLALFKNVFDNFICIKISWDTISPKQIHEEKHPLTSWGSPIAYTNHQAVTPTCKNEKSKFEKSMLIFKSSSIKCKILDSLLIIIAFARIANLQYFEFLFFSFVCNVLKILFSFWFFFLDFLDF